MSDIIIYGRGKTGQSVHKMLQQLHKDAVFFDDVNGFDPSGEFCSNSLVLVSPGVLPDADGLRIARSVGARVVGETEFCFPFCKGKCISVTGTNGKTTTCEMIHSILRQSGRKCCLLGNGGVPFSSRVLDVTQEEIVVLESSSFQLADCNCFAPFVSVFTSLAPDHLNYHGSYENYRLAKENNFVHQAEGFALFNADDEAVVEVSSKCKCTKLFYSAVTAADCFLQDDKLVLRCENGFTRVDARGLRRFCGHNVSNALAAVLACACVGVPAEFSVRCLENFQLLPHRLQLVNSFDGVDFVDDSKATNVHATQSALKCFDKNLVLILGGSDKGESFDGIFESLPPNVKAVFAVGETANKIAESAKRFNVDVVVTDDLRKAAMGYRQLLPQGGVVLMSNACASFDHFKNYAERGDYFRNAVEEIKRERQKI